MTVGEWLVEKSSLAVATALDHLLNIRSGIVSSDLRFDIEKKSMSIELDERGESVFGVERTEYRFDAESSDRRVEFDEEAKWYQR